MDPSDLRDAARRVDAWFDSRPRATALVYLVVLWAVWTALETGLAGRPLAEAALFGALFGGLYVAIAWFWGDMSQEALVHE